MTLNRIALAAFFILGIAASWADHKTKKVRNTWIVAALAFCSVGYALLATGPGGSRYLLHAALVAAATAILWLWKIWPAGDAKLFFALALLATLARPDLRGFPEYLFLVHLINIFLLAGFFVLALSLKEIVSGDTQVWNSFIQRRRGELQRLAGDWLKPVTDILLRLNFFLAAQFIQDRFNIFPPTLLGRLGSFIAIWLLANAVFKRLNAGLNADHEWTAFSRAVTRTIPLTAGVVLVAVLANVSYRRMGMQAFALAFAYWASYLVFSAITRSFFKEARLVPVTVGSLESGMILSGASWQKLRELGTKVGFEVEEVAYIDGLSPEEAATLRTRLSEFAEFPLAVHETRSFAVWVFCGCLWTLFQRKTVLDWILSP